MKKPLQPLTPAALYARVSSERQDVDLSVSALALGQPPGCAPYARSSTGSRRSLSPRALVTFKSVARVGLPSSDSAS